MMLFGVVRRGPSVMFSGGGAVATVTAGAGASGAECESTDTKLIEGNSWRRVDCGFFMARGTRRF